MGSPERGNPPPVDSLAADTGEGFDEAGKLPARIARYGRARARAREILAYLRRPELAPHCWRERRALAGCGNYLHFRHYYTVGKVRLHRANFCGRHLLCPLCAIRRGAKMLAAYLAKFHVLVEENPSWKPYMVTLTVLNGPDLIERFEHLRGAVRAMIKARGRALSGSRDISIFTEFHAVVGSYELTNKGNGWHPHVHMLVLASERPSQAVLCEEWKKRTGDSLIVDVTPMDRSDAIAKDFCEVFKYAVKFSEMSVRHCVYAYTCLHGRRLLFSVGAFRGVKVPESLEDVPLDNLPYVELFYRYLDEVGYSYDAMAESYPPCA